MHPPDRIKEKNSKRSTTLMVKTYSFYWCQQSGGVSPTPSICRAERIFGLGWIDWACYFRGASLTTGHNILLYVMSHLSMSTNWNVIPYQHLSHDSWLLNFLTPHLVPINIYLCSLVIFVRVLMAEGTES
jgi:hypothetical protein